MYLELTGIEPILQGLTAFDRKLQSQVVLGALENAILPLLMAESAAVPRRTGLLQQSLRIVKGKLRQGLRPAAMVRAITTEGAFKRAQGKRMGHRNMMLRPDSKKKYNVFYDLFVAQSHMAGKRGRYTTVDRFGKKKRWTKIGAGARMVPGRDFIRPKLQQVSPEMVKILGNDLAMFFEEAFEQAKAATPAGK